MTALCLDDPGRDDRESTVVLLLLASLNLAGQGHRATVTHMIASRPICTQFSCSYVCMCNSTVLSLPIAKW